MEPGAKLAAAFRKYPVWPVASETAAPRAWRDPSDPNFEPSIYQAPLQELDPNWITEIIGRSEHAAKGLRRTMQARNRRIAQAIAQKEDDGFAQFLRDLITGVWWHKRHTDPQAEYMVSWGAQRRGTTKFGEPSGTSLTKYPYLSGFGDKLWRTMVETKGDPLDEILFHQWEPHAEVLNEAYARTVFEFGTTTHPELKNMKDYRDLRHAMDVSEFNDALTANLEKLGYKGVLYSPVERYGEYELKMFPGGSPKGHGSNWAYPLDRRKLYGKEVERYDKMLGSKMRAQWKKHAETGVYDHLKEHYKEIDLEDVARQIREGKWTGYKKIKQKGFQQTKIPDVGSKKLVEPTPVEIVQTEGQKVYDYIQFNKGTPVEVSKATAKIEQLTGIDQKTIIKKIMNNKGGELFEAAANKEKK